MQKCESGGIGRRTRLRIEYRGLSTVCESLDSLAKSTLSAFGRLQADASLRLLDSLHERLMNNALYCDRLCWTRKREIEDPNDVLIKAEQRKRESAAQQQRRERESEEGE